MNPSIPASQFMGSGGLSTSPGGVPNTASPVSTGPISASDFMAGGSLSTTPIQPTAQPTQTPAPTFDWGGYFNSVMNDWKNAGQTAVSDVTQGAAGIAQGVSGNSAADNEAGAMGVEKSTLGEASNALQAIFAPITEGVKQLANTMAQNVTPGSPLYNLAQTKGVGAVLDTLSGTQGGWDSFSQAHPGLASTISDATNIALGLVGEKVAPEGDIETGIKSGTNAVKNAVTTSPEATAKAATAEELENIKENISPAPTAKEIKLATQQGRIVTGTEPTLLRGGTPDQILTSDKVANSTFTIQKEIPGAGQMSQPDLYTALTARTTEMAQNLEPQMQAVKVSPESIDTFQKDLEALQDSQIKNADASDEGNVAKRQQAFYERAQAITPDSTLDTVWKERIAYDDSIPSNVKNANNMSSESLQIKKEEWLQNRALYNNIINDAESGLGQTSQQAFRDMSSMYDAKANLLSKAKSNFEATAQPSKVVQWMRDHPYITGGIVTGAASATGIPGKLIKTVTGL